MLKLLGIYSDSGDLMRKFLKVFAVFMALLLCFGILEMKNEKAVHTAVYNVGSSGTRVEQILRRLAEYGFYTGAVDGVYGQGTFNAVKNFQRNNGLVPDGIVGDTTLSALGLFFGTSEIGSDERELLARVIYGEGRGEPYEGQVAIGAVVLNRVESEDFPDSISGVVYQTGAFDAVRDGQLNLEPDETAYSAADDAIAGWDPTGGALYYWNPATATSRWIWSIPITYSVGRHVFGSKQ